MALAPPPGFSMPAHATPTKKFNINVRTRADVLIRMSKENQWRKGAELGTGEGKTAAQLLSKCLQLHLTTIDLWEGQPDSRGPENWTHWPHRIHENAARARLSGFSRRVKIIKGWTVEAAARIEDRTLDFVFIDADHSEDAVRADIAAWTPKIKAGGYLLGHDASWPGVKAAIDDLCPGYWIAPDNVWGIRL